MSYQVSGSATVAAELARCSRASVRPARAGDGDGLLEDPHLGADRRVGGRVGVGHVAPQPDDARRRPSACARAAAATSAGQSVGRRALAGEPGVDLEVHAGGAAGGAGGGDHLGQAPVGVRPRPRRRRSSAAAKSVPGPCSQASTGAVTPAGAQRQRLVEDGDPEGVRAAGEDGAGGRDQPVAVAVGLDHRHQRAADPLAQHRGVGGDRVEVDDDLGAGGCGSSRPRVSQAGAPGPRAPGRSPPGSRRTRSPATSGPRSRGELPGPAVQVGGDRAGLGRRQAGRQQRRRRCRTARRRCRRWPATACRCR